MEHQIDVEHMSALELLLDDYAFISNPKNAAAVYVYLTGTKQPRMPPGGPYWSDKQLDLFLNGWPADDNL